MIVLECCGYVPLPGEPLPIEYNDVHCAIECERCGREWVPTSRCEDDDDA